MNKLDPSQTPPSSITLGQAFWYWLKLGFVSFGGPAGQIAILHQELVESTPGNLKFTAPLTGITAAVVGAILNLALFFGWHVFWPHGFSRQFDAVAAFICLFALLALFRYKIGVIPVIAASGVLGLSLVFIKPWLIQLGFIL